MTILDLMKAYLKNPAEVKPADFAELGRAWAQAGQPLEAVIDTYHQAIAQLGQQDPAIVRPEATLLLTSPLTSLLKAYGETILSQPLKMDGLKRTGFEQLPYHLNTLLSEMCLLDNNGVIVAINRAWRDFAEQQGYPGDDHGLGQNYLTVCSQAAAGGDTIAQLVWQGLLDMLAGERTHFEQIYPCQTPEKLLWFTMHADTVTIDGATCIAIVHQDITEHRYLKEKLRNQFYQNISDAIITTDPDFKIQSWNQAAASIYGWSVEEVIGKRFDQLTSLVYLNHSPEAVAAQIFDQGYWEGELLQTTSRSQRVVIFSKMRLAKGDQGEPAEVVVINRDVTRQKVVEKTLQASEKRFRLIFEHIPIGIVEADFSHTPVLIIRANKQARQIYGWDHEAQSKPKPLATIFSAEDDTTLPQLQAMLQDDVLRPLETISLRPDGRFFPVRLGARTTVTGLSGVIITIEDITIETGRQAAKEAVALERQRIARDIHDGVAQTLASIRLKIPIWQDMIAQKPAQLVQQLDNLNVLLGDTSREIRRAIYALNPVVLDQLGFIPAVHQSLEEISQQHGLEVTLKIHGVAEALPSKLESDCFRIIHEALHNVIKHARAHQVQVALDFGADRVGLTVTDDGLGFDPDQISPADTGLHLGLHQMRTRVAHLNGTFSISSQSTQGTTLRVSLPYD